jgi:NADH-quinone oxidoreductase subunit F
MGVTLRELIYDHCGGMRDGRALKAVIPGGASTPILSADQIDTALDFDSIAKAGSAMGSTAVMVMDETTCIVGATLILTRFFAHESCGQCTPCREGTHWAERILHRFEHGGAKREDIDLLLDLCSEMGGGRTICALADGAINPIRSGIEKFRSEYEAHVERGCPQRGQLCEVGW